MTKATWPGMIDADGQCDQCDPPLLCAALLLRRAACVVPAVPHRVPHKKKSHGRGSDCDAPARRGCGRRRRPRCARHRPRVRGRRTLVMLAVPAGAVVRSRHCRRVLHVGNGLCAGAALAAYPQLYRPHSREPAPSARCPRRTVALSVPAPGRRAARADDCGAPPVAPLWLRPARADGSVPMQCLCPCSGCMLPTLCARGPCAAAAAGAAGQSKPRAPSR